MDGAAARTEAARGGWSGRRSASADGGRRRLRRGGAPLPFWFLFHHEEGAASPASRPSLPGRDAGTRPEARGVQNRSRSRNCRSGDASRAGRLRRERPRCPRQRGRHGCSRPRGGSPASEAPVSPAATTEHAPDRRRNARTTASWGLWSDSFPGSAAYAWRHEAAHTPDTPQNRHSIRSKPLRNTPASAASVFRIRPPRPPTRFQAQRSRQSSKPQAPEPSSRRHKCPQRKTLPTRLSRQDPQQQDKPPCGGLSLRRFDAGTTTLQRDCDDLRMQRDTYCIAPMYRIRPSHTTAASGASGVRRSQTALMK